MLSEPKKYLQNLGLAESETEVYLAMVAGDRLARDLVKATGLKRPTVYYALGALERRGLIAKTGLSGSRQFVLTAPERLSELAKTQVQEATALAEDIASALPLFTPADAAAEGRPSVTFFEGKEAVKGAIMDMLYTKSGHIDSVAPSKNFFWEVGEAFVVKFITERRQRGIHTRNLWEKTIARAVFLENYQGLSSVRIVPSVMRGRFPTSTFLYDDKVLYVSSLKNAYAILITSQEHHDTMKAWFEGLWSTSKPHPL